MTDEEIQLYTEWVEMARLLEKDLAISQLKRNQLEYVLENFSSRLTNKMLFPLIKFLENKELNIYYNSKQSIDSYTENYLKKYDPKADHVIDE